MDNMERTDKATEFVVFCIENTALRLGVIVLLAKTLHISQERALDLFYTSDTYHYLSNLQFHLHNMGDAYLVDEIILEIQNRQ